eukprot:scaffold85690_cov29-Tisochrysis_lutea.AAC.1
MFDLSTGRVRRYKKRASSLIKEMERRHASILDKRIELNCFRSLEEREALAAPQRLNDLTAMVAEQVRHHPQSCPCALGNFHTWPLGAERTG